MANAYAAMHGFEADDYYDDTAQSKKRKREPKASKKEAKGKGRKVKDDKKKRKKKKDKNAPKKALSAYFFYMNAVRDDMKRQYPDAKLTAISKMIGERWKQMTDSEKRPFLRKADQDKVRYAEQKKNYHPPDDLDDGRRKRKKKDPLAPKKPLTAYFVFMKEQREETKRQHPNLKVSELTKIFGEKWKNLPEEKKKFFQEKAALDRARYLKEQHEYLKATGRLPADAASNEEGVDSEADESKAEDDDNVGDDDHPEGDEEEEEEEVEPEGDVEDDGGEEEEEEEDDE